MYNILLSCTLAFIVTFFSIPIIIQVARDKKLFDEPDERKVHKTMIPTLGGLGIFAGFILATLLGVPPGSGSVQIQYFAAAAIAIFFLGIKDDILALSAGKKFIGQLIAAGIIIKFGGISIHSMHSFFGLNEIPHSISVIFSLFTIIVITNSFNLIDGVDGLAGSLGLLTTIIFGSYFLYIGELMYAVLAFSLAGSLIGFLIYNFSPAKIFMGDTGSLLIGLINSILVIKFINIADAPTVKLPLEAVPAIAFSLLIVPLFDTLRVFGLRILNRRSPFSPDRNHIHHFLLDLGYNHRAVTFICVLVNLALIAIAFFARHLGTTADIAILLSTSSAFILICYYSGTKNKQVIRTKPSEEKLIKPRRILTLVSRGVEAE
jgi:UDP-GlcNAc:undecaprenyl-phosphate/decaprenyl-phosphate GlcNAc-1-phosphate transferase